MVDLNFQSEAAPIIAVVLPHHNLLGDHEGCCGPHHKRAPALSPTRQAESVVSTIARTGLLSTAF